ncbi:hypothetical protein BLA29_004615 [Euroglyphus maynei]|uniref:Uncharacterized protein n=1 Tax=Euroglyphus maynei TaxID=6958 RepID=A0A1Y3BH78_EURMA|nr:hypothetical protein BLA29_004615 [Euroglyphus maynei]
MGNRTKVHKDYIHKQHCDEPVRCNHRLCCTSLMPIRSFSFGFNIVSNNRLASFDVSLLNLDRMNFG